MQFRQNSAPRGQHVVLVLIALIGLFGSLWLYRSVRQREWAVASRRFDRQSIERVRAIQREINTALLSVQSGAALFESMGTVSRSEFRDFASTVLQNGSLIGLGWDPVVSSANRLQHENLARARGLDDYRITERDATGALRTAGSRSEFVPVFYLEPIRGNERAIGFDIASEPVRRAALKQSVAHGGPAVTGRIHLVQESGEAFGVLLVVPVFQDDERKSSETWGRTRGWVVGVMNMPDVVDRGLGHLEPAGIDLSILDGNARSDQQLLHQHASRTRNPGARVGTPSPDEELTYKENFDFAGRSWSIVCSPTERYLAAMIGWAPLTSLAVGWLITGLLLAYVWRVTRLTRRLSNAVQRQHHAQRTNLRLTGILQATTDFVGMADTSGKITYVNRAGRRMLDYADEEDLTGKPITEFHPLESGDRVTREGLPAARRNGAWQGETMLLTRDGREIPTSQVLLCHRSTGDEIEFYSTIARDISDRRTVEELLRRRSELAAEELDRLKHKLVRQTRLAAIGQVAASIAHELRNPLGGIRNAAFFMKRQGSDLPQKHLGYLDRIGSETAKAERIIRDLLEMTRSPAPRRTDVGLREMINRAFSRSGDTSGIRLQLDFDPGFRIHADPDQFDQVLTNLLTNAVQAQGGSGQIRVQASDGAETRITIEDGGPGISPEVRDLIFEPLFTTKAKGTGLGLTICRQIVDLHEGSLDLVDSPTGNTAFCIRLPGGSDSLHASGRDGIHTKMRPGRHLG